MSLRIDDGKFSFFRFAKNRVGFFKGYALGGSDEIGKGCHYSGDRVLGGGVELDVAEGYYTEEFPV